MVELAERDGFARRRGAALLGGLTDQLKYAGDADGIGLGRAEGGAVAHLPW